MMNFLFHHLFEMSYFKSEMTKLLKCCTYYASKLGELSGGHRIGKGQFSFQSQRQVTTKNVHITI